MSRRIWIMLMALLLPVAAQAREWQVVAADSTLGFSGTLQGREFVGVFGEFEVDIRFDRDQLRNARFDVQVNLGSVDTGNGDRNDMLRGEDFFAVDKWPHAQFVSNSFSRAEDGTVMARGTLTLRDVSKPVLLRVQFEPGADSATLDVDSSMDRLEFGLGTGDDWAGISEQIRVHAHLILR